MPRIPEITASGQAATVQLPSRVPYGTSEGLTQLGQGVGQVGEAAGGLDAKIKNKQYEIDQRLLQQQEENLVATAKGQYNAAKKDFKNDLSKPLLDADGKVLRDPLPAGQWEPEYTQRLAERVKTLKNWLNAQSVSLGGTKYTPKNASLAFEKFVNEDQPETLAAIRQDARVAFLAEEKGKLFEDNKAAALKAGDADPKTAEAMGKVTEDRITRAEKRGVITPLEAARERYTYEQTRLATNLRTIADSIKTPDGAIDYSAGAAIVYKLEGEGIWNRLDSGVKAKLMEGIQARVHVQGQILEHNVNKAKQAYTQASWSLANIGALGPYIEDIAKGLTPIDPSHAEALKHRNDNPVIGGGNVDPIRALEAEYKLGRVGETGSRLDIGRVRDFMKRLNALQPIQGIDTKALIKFGNELQNDEASAQSMETARKAAGLRDKHEIERDKDRLRRERDHAAQAAVKRFVSTYPEHYYGEASNPRKRNNYLMNKAWTDTQVRAGRDVEEVFKELETRMKKQKTDTPADDKTELQKRLLQSLPKAN